MIMIMKELVEDTMHVSQGDMPMSGADALWGTELWPAHDFTSWFFQPRVASDYLQHTLTEIFQP